MRGSLLVAAVLLAALMIASPLPAVGVLAVPLVLLALAYRQPARDRAMLCACAEAAVVLGIYRVAVTTIPLVWYGADAVGHALGNLAGLLSRRPLSVGATMGGVDYLVPMLYLALVLPLRCGGIAVGSASSPSQTQAGSCCRWKTGWKPALLGCCVLAVLLGHLAYLLTLALAGEMVSPWNLPALAAAIHAVIVFGLLWVCVGRGGERCQPDTDKPPSPSGRGAGGEGRLPWLIRLLDLAITAAIALLAAAVPVVTVLCWHKPDLSDKKIVFYEKGFLNWLKPEHGQYGEYSPGMYGMLPTFMESLGIKAVISADLAEKDLDGANALVIIYPNQPWDEEQLRRIDDFVRGGGSLMVMGEHTVRENDGGSRINDVLEPTAMRVPFDSALFAIGGWLHSYEAISHPTSAGIGDETNQFGVVIGGSVEAHWPARPLLIGRWGWADRGNAMNGDAKLGDRRYEAGERLGDVVLAAEQPLGAGRVICFGDPSMLVNGLTPECYPYTSRLFAYLVADGGTPQAAGRQFSGLAGVVVLLVLLVWRPSPLRLAAAAIVLAASLVLATAVTHRVWDVLPGVGPELSVNLVYIDGGHLNAHSPETWRDDGLGGLELTFMRNGYLPLVLKEMTSRRLSEAKVLFVDAPAREYSAAERRAVEEFVEQGGILIYTVGWEQIGPSRRLLEDLGFQVGRPEGVSDIPLPLGHYKTPFFNGRDYVAFVRFHAAWPVYCSDPKAMVLHQCVAGEKPVIVARRIKKGVAVVIGDTCFAMNKNLENKGGEPIEGLRKNAVFWRWFLPFLSDGKPWYPPKPVVELPTAETPPSQPSVPEKP